MAFVYENTFEQSYTYEPVGRYKRYYDDTYTRINHYRGDYEQYTLTGTGREYANYRLPRPEPYNYSYTLGLLLRPPYRFWSQQRLEPYRQSYFVYGVGDGVGDLRPLRFRRRRVPRRRLPLRALIRPFAIQKLSQTIFHPPPTSTGSPVNGSTSTSSSPSSSPTLASAYRITSPRIRRPISIAIGRYRATPIRNPVPAYNILAIAALSSAVSHTRESLSRYIWSSRSPYGSGNLYRRRNILSNGNNHAIYATAIHPTRSGKNLATLPPAYVPAARLIYTFYRLRTISYTDGPTSRITLPGPTSSYLFYGSVANDYPVPTLTVLSAIRFISNPSPALAYEPAIILSNSASPLVTSSRTVRSAVRLSAASSPYQREYRLYVYLV
ncbi:hypothetical protein BR93DRAFT_967274 [Coniochaeta sp. PMI_546]|nr:hypothetical protein BR93DRAFT_967274 [Coniochaeta sp. PMI_546]